ncbi:tetratricopeptide repeat protein [bacterium SCSIO 12696]|nr:tetratricopeptide repeat protein [bacterium SCSIO 12696]
MTVGLYSTAATETAIDQYQQAIDEQEALYGAYDSGLAELHLSFGEALQTAGEHQQAIDIFKRALHIRRVNDGITSLSQETALRELNQSYRATGNVSATASNYQDLISLLQVNPSSDANKLPPLLLEASNWHRQQYSMTVTKEAITHLIEADRLLSQAKNNRLNSDQGFREALLQAEIQNRYWRIRHYQKYVPTPPRSYVERNSFRFRGRLRGESSFEYQQAYNDYLRRQTSRLARTYQKEQIQWAINSGLGAYQRLDKLYQNDNNSLQQAINLAEQGDWLMLFNTQPEQAHALYRQSWQVLTEQNQIDTRAKLFDKPQLLPTFHQPDATTATQLAQVTADLTPDGRTNNIVVVKTEPDNPKVAKRAERQLRNARFRNRMEAGEPVTSKNFELNFFVN